MKRAIRDAARQPNGIPYDDLINSVARWMVSLAYYGEVRHILDGLRAAGDIQPSQVASGLVTIPHPEALIVRLQVSWMRKLNADGFLPLSMDPMA